MPYEEAREYVRSLGLKSQREWHKYRKSGKRPDNIPSDAQSAYNQSGDWISLNDWIGSNNTSDRYREFRDFNDARDFARSLKFKTWGEWRRFTKSADFPEDIPVHPYRSAFYKEKWISEDDWLGTKLFRRGDEYRDFKKARKFVRALSLKSRNEWAKYCKSGKKPNDIPGDPGRIYKDKGYKSVGDWLGTGRVADQYKVFLSYSDAKKFVHALGLKNQAAWNEYRKSGKKPDNIPSNPAGAKAYKDDWKGWGDWLGTGRVGNKDKKYKSFLEAREFARNTGIKSQLEWNQYWKANKIPEGIPLHPRNTYKEKGWKGFGDWLGTGNVQGKIINIPSNPHQVYKGKGWKGFGDWLGTDRIAAQDMQFMSYIEAQEYVSKLNIKTLKEWNQYWRKNERPIDLPSAPQSTYKNKGWISWGDFLGTGRISDNLKKYRSFKEARKFARKLKLKSQVEWFEYCKSGNKPDDIPRRVNNSSHYINEWNGWADFLGKDEGFSKEKGWNFEKARKYVHKLGLKSQREWAVYCKSGKKPDEIPAGAWQEYENEWISWGDWLGTGITSNRDQKFHSFKSSKEMIIPMRFKNRDEYQSYCRIYNKSNEIKLNLNPHRRFKKDWKGWSNFLRNE
jgi:hypothetical protein